MINLQAYSNISNVIFRVAFSLIFIVGGSGHFFRHDWMLSRLQASPWLDWVMLIGSPSILLWLSGVVMIVAGLTLLAGWFTQLSALALFFTLIPITFVIHVAPDHVGPLLKNVAILGGLIHFIVNGAKGFSIDQVLARKDNEVNL